MKRRVPLADETQTQALAARLAQALTQSAPSDACVVLYLRGDLGAGKTTFSRHLIQALGHHGAVKSPTYTLIEPYPLPWGSVFHMDLYRLSDPQELDFMGVADIFSLARLCLIEWPSKGEGFLQSADIELNCCIDDEAMRAGDASARVFEFVANSALGELILTALE